MSLRAPRRRILGAAGFLAGAAHLASPAAQLSRAQSTGRTALPPGKLAYLLGGHLWLAAGEGADRRLAMGTGGWLQDPSWSPDGTQLAYAHVRFPLTTAPGTIPWPSAEIEVVRADAATDPSVLVPREQPNDTLVSPAWSSDGRSLYVIRRRPLDPTGMNVAVDLLRVDLSSGDRASVPLTGEPIELTAGDDGSLAVVTLTTAPSGASTARLLRLVPDDPGLAPVEIANSEQALRFITLPQYERGSQRLLFAADAAGYASRLPPPLEALIGPTAEAHGARGWVYVADLRDGALRRVPSDGFDDLVALAWIDARRAMLLDAGGIGILDLEDGSMLRVPRLTATGFAWYPAP